MTLDLESSGYKPVARLNCNVGRVMATQTQGDPTAQATPAFLEYSVAAEKRLLRPQLGHHKTENDATSTNGRFGEAAPSHANQAERQERAEAV
jgi:hypothetical protein